MKKILITLLFLVIFLFLTSFNTKSVGEVVKLRYERGLYFAPLELNNKKGYFLVDTGAIISILDVNQSKKYKFSCSKTGRELVGVGGEMDEYKISKYSIYHNNKILPVIFRGVDLSPVVNSFIKNNDIEIVGIIGANFFVSNKVIIDYSNNYMIIYKK